MHDETSKELRTTLTSAGKLELSIVTVPMPEPREGEVLVRWRPLPSTLPISVCCSGQRMSPHSASLDLATTPLRAWMSLRP